MDKVFLIKEYDAEHLVSCIKEDLIQLKLYGILEGKDINNDVEINNKLIDYINEVYLKMKKTNVLLLRFNDEEYEKVRKLVLLNYKKIMSSLEGSRITKIKTILNSNDTFANAIIRMIIELRAIKTMAV